MRELRVIDVAMALGAPIGGAEAAPATLRRAGLDERLRGLGWRVVHQAPGAADGGLGGLLRALADCCARPLPAGGRWLIVGGDHSLAAGSWRGIGRALGRAPGLLWIDAHLDAHTAHSSPSGRAHGMPLAALFGLGAHALAGVPGPALDPDRTLLIGTRSYEAAEYRRLRRLGVAVRAMPEIARCGLAPSFAAALARLAGAPWGLSLDVDALDPVLAPGVSTPVAGGLGAGELGAALRGLLHRRDCVALEIVEYNPRRDPDGRTAALLLELICAAASSQYDRVNLDSEEMTCNNR